MLFSSFSFFLFFVLFYAVYWLSNSRLRLRNTFLLLGSYFFYGCWDWRFLSLIIISTLVDFLCGARIHASTSQGRRGGFLAMSVITNLGLLGTFKYFDFFATSLVDLAGMAGWKLDYATLKVMMMAGYSTWLLSKIQNMTAGPGNSS